MIEKVSGWVGSFFYAICYLPQVLGTCKNKSPELNMSFIYLQFLGSSFMFLYGVTNKLYPIMALNGLAWICLVLIMGGHFRNKKNNPILN